MRRRKLMSNNIVSRLKRKKIQEVISTGKRMDGRELLEYRDMIIKRKPLEKAEGSSEVWLGKTHIMCGVKAGIGTPFDDTPDQGVMMVNAEFTPIAHPTWEPGPPPDEAVELARVVDRGLRSAEILDVKKLCVVEGEKVYIVFIDLYILNYDGNLIDACAAGAIAALETAEISIFKEADGVITDTGKKRKLELEKKPVAVTMVKIGDDFILDPNVDEEEVMDSRLTITFDEDGNVTTIQKSGPVGFSMEEIKKCINIASEKAPEIREIIAASE
jgi:exosome complex component RRP42